MASNTVNTARPVTDHSGEVYNTPNKGSNVSFCMLCHVRVLVVRHQNANRAYTPPVHGRLSRKSPPCTYMSFTIN